MDCNQRVGPDADTSRAELERRIDHRRPALQVQPLGALADAERAAQKRQVQQAQQQ